MWNGVPPEPTRPQTPRMPRRPRQARSATRRASSSAGASAPSAIQWRLVPSARPTSPWASCRRCGPGEALDVDEGGDGLRDRALDLGDLGRELLVAPGAAAEEHPERGLVGLDEPEVGDEAELHLLVGRLGGRGGLGDGVEQVRADSVSTSR